jgi:hypothetical protein
MKAKLIKTDKDNYTLFDEKGIPIGNTPNVISNNTFSKLSKQNCDEIFGVIDVEKLAGEITKEYATLTPKAFKRGVVLGFNKAMELNKDKVFTLENVVELASILISNPLERSGKTARELVDAYILSTQQPTEIEVEIEIECPQCQEWGYVSECRNDCNQKFLQPKVDSEGCLILKKI